MFDTVVVEGEEEGVCDLDLVLRPDAVGVDDEDEEEEEEEEGVCDLLLGVPFLSLGVGT